MSHIATTHMSSKGQVVIPEEIRNRLGLRTGTQFVVVGDRDAVILRAITPPSLDEFEPLLSAARQAARRSGLKKSEIKEATEKIRNKRASKRIDP
jgi:AbrB family looped-hinge helix DNA binding protein